MEKKYKPILFSTEMVLATLEGRKSQTRRTQGLSSLNKNPDLYGLGKVQINGVFNFYLKENEKGIWIEPKYKIGDILWVRETYANPPLTAFGVPFIYKADFDRTFCGWKPSIHMPKAAARIFLEVVNVRCERLHDIKEEDAIAEGIHFDVMFKKFNCYLCDNQGHIGGEMMCEDGFYKTALNSFSSLWQSINGKRHTWQSNPWVWVYEFKKIEKPTVWPQ